MRFPKQLVLSATAAKQRDRRRATTLTSTSSKSMVSMLRRATNRQKDTPHHKHAATSGDEEGPTHNRIVHTSFFDFPSLSATGRYRLTYQRRPRYRRRKIYLRNGCRHVVRKSLDDFLRGGHLDDRALGLVVGGLVGLRPELVPPELRLRSHHNNSGIDAKIKDGCQFRAAVVINGASCLSSLLLSSWQRS